MTNARPTGASWLSPYITVLDVDKAVDFYQRAFTFKIENIVPGEDGINSHAEMKYKDQLIMCGRQGAWGSTMKSPQVSGLEIPINLYVYCENVDDFYKNAIAQGATSISEPEDMFWGDRMCTVKDPDGYSWSFATFVG